MKMLSRQMIDEVSIIRDKLKDKEIEIDNMKNFYQKLLKEKYEEIDQLKKYHTTEMNKMRKSLLESSQSEKSLLNQLRDKENLIRNLMKNLSSMSENEKSIVVTTRPKMKDKVIQHNFENEKDVQINTNLIEAPEEIERPRTSVAKHKPKNPFEMLKKIKVEFRPIGNNFVIDSRNESICFLDEWNEIVYGDKKPILVKSTKSKMRQSIREELNRSDTSFIAAFTPQNQQNYSIERESSQKGRSYKFERKGNIVILFS